MRLVQVESSLGLPGFLRGALDRFSLKRRAQDARAAARERPPAPGAADAAVPISTDLAIEQAAADLVAAVAAEGRRLRVDVLVPGQNPTIEDRFPYDEPELLRIAFEVRAAPSLLKKFPLPPKRIDPPEVDSGSCAARPALTRAWPREARCAARATARLPHVRVGGDHRGRSAPLRDRARRRPEVTCHSNTHPSTGEASTEWQ